GPEPSIRIPAVDSQAQVDPQPGDWIMYCRPAKDGSEEKRNDKQRIVHLPQGTDEEHPDQQQGRGRECTHHAILVPSGTAPRQQGESADEDEYCGENAPQPYRCSAGAEVHTDTDDRRVREVTDLAEVGHKIVDEALGLSHQ